MKIEDLLYNKYTLEEFYNVITKEYDKNTELLTFEEWVIKYFHEAISKLQIKKD